MENIYGIKRNEVLIVMKIMLNQMLDEKGVSQNQLAKDTGISLNTLRNLNHGRTTRSSFDTLENLQLLRLRCRRHPFSLKMDFSNE